jgi:hypothetical protein
MHANVKKNAVLGAGSERPMHVSVLADPSPATVHAIERLSTPGSPAFTTVEETEAST